MQKFPCDAECIGYTDELNVVERPMNGGIVNLAAANSGVTIECMDDDDEVEILDDFDPMLNLDGGHPGEAPNQVFNPLLNLDGQPDLDDDDNDSVVAEDYGRDDKSAVTVCIVVM